MRDSLSRDPASDSLTVNVQATAGP
jgi:hypothetical protein